MAKRVGPDDREAGLAGFLGRAWDAVAPAIGEAIADIRKRVIEEGWFGREVTPKEMSIHAPAAELHSGFHELMALQPSPPEAPDMPAPGIER